MAKTKKTVEAETKTVPQDPEKDYYRNLQEPSYEVVIDGEDLGEFKSIDSAIDFVNEDNDYQEAYVYEDYSDESKRKLMYKSFLVNEKMKDIGSRITHKTIGDGTICKYYERNCSFMRFSYVDIKFDNGEIKSFGYPLNPEFITYISKN